MKKLSKWLPFFLAALLVIAGAALPYGAFWIQNALAEGKTETRKLSAVRLSVQEDQRIGQILQMRPDQSLQMKWDGTTNLTAQEVENSVKEAAGKMSRAGLLESAEVADGEAIAYLYVSEKDWQISAIVWQYIWIDGEKRCYANVDDASGKLLGLLHGESEYDGAEMADQLPMEELEPLAHKWIAFCKDYYGISTFALSAVNQSEMSSWFTFTFTLGEVETQTCEIQVILYNDCVIFNI